MKVCETVKRFGIFIISGSACKNRVRGDRPRGRKGRKERSEKKEETKKGRRQEKEEADQEEHYR